MRMRERRGIMGRFEKRSGNQHCLSSVLTSLIIRNPTHTFFFWVG